MNKRYGLPLLGITIATVCMMFSAAAQMQNMSTNVLILSHPPLTGRVGVPYVYQMRASVSDSFAVVWFRGDRDNPPGLTVDSATGLVQWTPTVRGWFEIRLHAFSFPMGHAVQEFHVAVTSGNGIIQGKVTDTLSAGLPGIVIELFQAITPFRDGAPLFSFSTKTDANGNYRIKGIDPGSYKLRAVSYLPNFASQWYDGKTDPNEANTIIVADTPAVTIANFTLRAGPVRMPSFTASGGVSDTASAPIGHAAVFFVRSGFVLNRMTAEEDYRTEFDMAEPADDFRMEGISQHVYKRIADSLGRYSLSLPQGQYIAFAKAPGYMTEFYLEASDFLSASLITLTEDKDSIDFTLSQSPPVVLGSIQGSVYDSSRQVGVRSRIIAWSNQWTISPMGDERRAHVTDTDSTGAFIVADLPPGSYILLALPLGKYAPAFYSTDTVTMRWRMATQIAVNGTAVTGITIYVRPIPGRFSGYASIRGSVQTSSASSASMAGTLVFARAGGVTAGYGVTSAAGVYAVDGLAPGTYTVEVDRLGYQEPTTKSVTVSYTSLGSPVNATADFRITSVTSVESASSSTPLEFRLAQNYPNPFNPSTTIEYSVASTGLVTLRVYNLLGQAVGTLVDAVQAAGTHRVVFEATGLPSGVYFTRLEQAGLVQTRRMILMR